MKNTYNMNHESLFLNEIPFGKNYKISLKIGRRNYFLDVNKSSESASIDLYPANAISKYACNSILCVKVKNDAMLTRDFFEEIEAIKKAQEIQQKYRLVF